MIFAVSRVDVGLHLGHLGIDLRFGGLDVLLVLALDDAVEAHAGLHVVAERFLADALGLELGIELVGRELHVLGEALDAVRQFRIAGQHVVALGLLDLHGLVDHLAERLLLVEAASRNIVHHLQQRDALREVKFGDRLVVDDRHDVGSPGQAGPK